MNFLAVGLCIKISTGSIVLLHETSQRMVVKDLVERKGKNKKQNKKKTPKQTTKKQKQKQKTTGDNGSR